MSPLSRFILLTLGVLHGFLAWAQLQQIMPSGAGQSKATVTVSGTVVNALTGTPIARALVRLAGAVPAAVFTNESGRFQFDNVREGNAWLDAERPGFFREGVGPNAGSSGVMSMISIGPNSKDVQIKLTPEARIEGRVTDSDGEPIEGVQIQVMGERIVAGRKQFAAYAMASTTGSGHYLIGGLMPGTYYVHTLLRAVFGDQRLGQMVRRNYPLAYPVRYFPDSPDLASAQPQELKGGMDAEVDFTLPAQPTFRVSGTVTGAQNYLGVSLGESGETLPAHSAFNRRTGQFAVSLVTPGSWTLHFVSQDMQGTQYSATAEVAVADSDVTGLQVALQPDSSIPVTVQQNASGGIVPNPQITLLPREMGSRNRRFVATSRNSSSPGTLLIPNVPPGAYHVEAHAFGSACIESVTSGSTNLLHDDLTVAEGGQTPPLSVVLTAECGKILGVVHSNAGAVPSAVVLVPDSGAGDPVVMTTSPDGAFTSGLITPGNYRAYAFSSLANLEYANPDALRDYSGQEVSLAANQPVTVNLDLIERKE